MTGLSAGRRRNRIYVRKFDWAEARARYAAGETLSAIAKSYGVHSRAVQRVVHLPEYMIATATPEQVAQTAALGRNQVPCPRCSRPKSRHAELCRECHAETRALAPTVLEPVPGKKRVVLADVAAGRIVLVDGRWGVAMRATLSRKRLVDFWDGGREWVSDVAIVDVAPGTRVLLAGEVEEPEEITA